MERGTRSGGLDAMRATGALMVFANHLYYNGGIHDMGPLTPVGQTGSSGVVVFFVLSGYLIYRPFAGGKFRSLGSYAARRLLRIFPAYLVALVGVTVLFGRPGLESNVAGNVTLIAPSVIVPAWTLTIEVCFYVAAPLLAFVVARGSLAHQLGGLAFLAGASLAIDVATQVVLPWSGTAKFIVTTFPAVFWAFAPGMAIAALEARGPELLGRARTRLLPVAGLGSLWIGLLLGLDPWNNPMVVAGAAAIVAWVVVARPRVPRPIALLGIVSYGFYLWHYDVVEALVRAGLTGPALATVALIAALALGAASYVAVERPALNLVRPSRRSDGQPGVAVVADLAPLQTVGKV